MDGKTGEFIYSTHLWGNTGNGGFSFAKLFGGPANTKKASVIESRRKESGN